VNSPFLFHYIKIIILCEYKHRSNYEVKKGGNLKLIFVLFLDEKNKKSRPEKIMDYEL